MLPLPVRPRERQQGDRIAEPVLHWVMTGSAVLDVDGATHEVVAGQALWVPGGSRVLVRMRHDDVVVPVPGLALGRRARPELVDIPESWRYWLLHAFGEALGYLDGASSRMMLQQLLDASVPTPRHPEPALPASPELRDLVDVFLRAPAVPLGELARRTLGGWSSRTLQRRFSAETGMTLERWARGRRMVLAKDMLAAGRGIGAVASAVGYHTVSGFSRAFREHADSSPKSWQSQNSRATMRCRPQDAPDPALLPSQRSWHRVNGSHVAVCVLRGDAVLTIGGREHSLVRGEAVVLPAGIPNGIRITRGALVLPLGFRSGRDASIGAPFSPARLPSENEVVQAMVAAYTTVSPPGYEASRGFDLVCERSQRCAVSTGTAALSVLASALATGAVDDASLAGCARWAEVPERELSRIVNEYAGMTFAQWIRFSRMSRARAQLHGGAQTSNVSQQLGYAHLPAFSRAFRAVHGTSPQRIAVPIGRAGEAGRWHRTVLRAVRSNEPYEKCASCSFRETEIRTE